MRSDAAARVAVKLGYKNVYRDPKGYPEWVELGLPVESIPARLVEKEAVPEEEKPLSGLGFIWTLLAIFAGGMALNLTPCVYPLIPITVSYFGGQAGRQKSGLILHGLCYIIGLAMMNSTLGVIAALTGGLMGAILQNPVALMIVAAILVFFATSLLGLWEFRLPVFLTQIAVKSYIGYFNSLFMGLTLGLVAAPCIGPFILGLLAWVAGIGNVWIGFLTFFTLSLGLSIPLFLLALFSSRLEKLPRSGEWMVWVRKLLGWALIGMAAYFIRPLLPGLWGIILLSFIVLSSGLHLGWLNGPRTHFRAFNWVKTGVVLACLAISTFLITSAGMKGPGVTWQSYSEEILTDARIQEKPIVIDFYASWCAPCRKLEEQTFHNTKVVMEAEKNFRMIKVDLTRKGDSANEYLLKKYDVKGVPTVIFLDVNGREWQDLRLVEFMPPDQFLTRMAEAKRRAK